METIGDPQSGIELYMHCCQCLQEKPENQSPQEWVQIEAGIMPDGKFRVWCKRHQKNVVTFTDSVKLADSLGMKCGNPVHHAN